MPIYRITENNVLVGEYEAEKVEVLASGQIMLSTKNGAIGIFNQNVSCFSVDDFYKTERELIQEKTTKMCNDIHNIENRFGTDVFFEEKTPEFANVQLRQIYGILCRFGYDINLLKQ